MREEHDLVQHIRERRQTFNSSERFLLHDKMKQIQTEMVKLTFEPGADERLYKFFSTQLKRVKKQLSFK